MNTRFLKKSVAGIMALIALTSLAGISSPGSSPGRIFLVQSQDPTVLERLRPFTSVQRQVGRALLVELKQELELLPEELRQLLRILEDGDEVLTYTPALSRGTVDPRIEAVLAGISPERLRASVRQLTSYRDRSAGSAENRETAAWLKGRFEALGYGSRLQCYREGECNVIAERPPSGSDRWVVLTGHFDSVGAAYAGADDNASGAAGVLEIAEVMSSVPTRVGWKFIAFNGEEGGGRGSRHYVSSVSADELSRMNLAINLDMIAFNENGKVDIETDRVFEEQAKWLAGKAWTYTKLSPRITMPAWGSDHVFFIRAGVPTLLSIEFWDTKTPCYHRPCDQEAGLNFDYAVEILKMDLAALLEKAEF